MGDRVYKVRFEPSGRAVEVIAGATLMEAAGQAGLIINSPCGGAGACGKCRVRLQEATAPDATEQQALSPRAIEEGWRLACRRRVYEPTTAYLPEISLFGGANQIVSDYDADETPISEDPEIITCPVTLTPPAGEDNLPDFLRLEKALAEYLTAPLTASPQALNRFTQSLQQGYDGTAVLHRNRLVDFMPETSGPPAPMYGMAFDIGTTTLVGELMDLHSGRACRVLSIMNPQTIFGDDVISRITYAIQQPEGLEALRYKLTDAVAGMIQELCRQEGIPETQVYFVALSGNTTMEHLICGIDPTPISRFPFVPVIGRGLEYPAASFGWRLHPDAQVYGFPVIGGFVGGDTVAGVLATLAADTQKSRLLIDVGTNGEIVLARQGNLWAASTAAGPAFEGARISCGMRAAEGAIEKVVIDREVHLGVIGGGEPIGICGSGLIDLCGQLRRAGLLPGDGRLPTPGQLPADTPPALRDRFLVNAEGEVAFCIYRRPHAEDLLLTQRDIREVQLAAGAIRAGTVLLLKAAGITPDDLEEVLLAGGFGSFIRRDNAQRIGLLPANLAHDHIRYVGNASLAGARQVLRFRNARERAENIARVTRHVDLGEDPEFAMEFAMAMYFPE